MVTNCPQKQEGGKPSMSTYTVSQVAQKYDADNYTVYKWIYSGKLEAARGEDRRYIISDDSLRGFEAGCSSRKAINHELYFTIHDIAKKFDAKPKTVYSWVYKGWLNATMKNTSAGWLFTADDISAFEELRNDLITKERRDPNSYTTLFTLWKQGDNEAYEKLLRKIYIYCKRKAKDAMKEINIDLIDFIDPDECEHQIAMVCFEAMIDALCRYSLDKPYQLATIIQTRGLRAINEYVSKLMSDRLGIAVEQFPSIELCDTMDIEGIAAYNDNIDILRSCFYSDRITPREREVIILRYGLRDGITRTLEQVGKIFGFTKERVRQIEVKSFRKLRAILSERGVSYDDLWV